MTIDDLTRGPRRPFGEGPRHLMVSLMLRPRSAFVTSVAVAPGRPPQLLAAGHPWIAAVTRGEDIVHLSRVPDPFVQRGIRIDRTGPHHTSVADEGRAIVAVPFGSVTDLTQSLLHILDLGSRRLGIDREGLGEVVARRIKKGSGVRTLGFDAITASPQWATVGPMLGLTVDPARFEVYQDRAGSWRWRLRRAGGPIVAASSDAFDTRTEAEAEVTWIRRHAAGSPTTSLD